MSVNEFVQGDWVVTLVGYDNKKWLRAYIMKEDHIWECRIHKNLLFQSRSQELIDTLLKKCNEDRVIKNLSQNGQDKEEPLDPFQD